MISPIKEVSAAIINTLKAALPPLGIIEGKDIALSSDYVNPPHKLSLVLYNIVKLDAAVFNLPPPESGSLVLALDYMIAANCPDDGGRGSLDEQVILGAALELFNNKPFVELPDLSMPLRFTLSNISLEDRAKLQFKNPALYYQAAPVIIAAEQKDAARVRTVQIGE